VQFFTAAKRSSFRLPAQYFDEAAADEHRVAQQTDWIASIGGLVLGRGQRTLMIGASRRV
jgi:protein involved in temperature-dependent protein secretion